MNDGNKKTETSVLTFFKNLYMPVSAVAIIILLVLLFVCVGACADVPAHSNDFVSWESDMTGLALRNKKRIQAAMGKDPSTVSSPLQREALGNKDVYDRKLVNIKLQADLKHLSSLADVEEKRALKKNHLIPTYMPVVNAYIESGADHPNLALVWMVIWCLDVEDTEHAIRLAKHAIEQQQNQPERFKRDLATIVSEEISEWAERQYKQELSSTPYLEEVSELVATEKWLVDQFIVLTKLFKIRAMYCDRTGDHADAVNFYEKCVAANPDGHGVKTKLTKARLALAKRVAPDDHEAAVS